ncbi:ribonuclease H-like domain-containing protein, partial [Tanacetum coccineum]
VDAIPNDKSDISEGDDFYEIFGHLFQQTVKESQPTVDESQPNVILDNQGSLPRRSSRKTVMPARFSNFQLNTNVKYNIDKHVNYSKLSTRNFNFSTGIIKFCEPKSYTEASAYPRWIDVMNLEMETLNRNGTWIITNFPTRRKAIGCKWVYKVKCKSNEEVERFMSRLIAKGYNKKKGIDFDETFSQVVKIVTIRCMLSIYVQYSWPIFQLDINNAILYADLVEDVYMKLREGYFDSNDNRVCKLVKSLYGLKLTSVLLENEFVQSKNDFSLFIKSCKPCNTPIEVKEGMVKKGSKPVVDVPLTGITNYQKLVEKLIYLTHTRPDISYAVHVLSQYMHAPMHLHLRLAFRVLRYLKNAPSMGITFNKSAYFKLNVFVDSDYAKCKATRSSVSGYSVFLENSLPSSKSKKQSMLSKSSVEAEYKAMNTVTCEVMWIKKILTEFGITNSLSVNVNCENSSAIQIATNTMFHERTKHFEIELFFLREKVVAGIIKTMKVKLEDNIADLFTKGLSALDHEKFRRLLGLKDLYQN